jgi:hypothetical protein
VPEIISKRFTATKNDRSLSLLNKVNPQSVPSRFGGTLPFDHVRRPARGLVSR